MKLGAFFEQKEKMGSDDREWKNLVEEAEEATQSLADAYYKSEFFDFRNNWNFFEIFKKLIN